MIIQKICIIYNPVAGSGRGQSVAEDLMLCLQQVGLSPAMYKSTPSSAGAQNTFLEDMELAIIVGGDGTLMHALPSLAKYQTPIYMLPTGNESLFAREFKMSTNAEDVLKAIHSWELTEHYFASVSGTPFFTMASLGLDSEVIEAISRVRKGTINRWSYFMPMLRAARNHQPPIVTVSADGKPCLEQAEGFLIIANNKQYALGAAFVPEAHSKHPELCARFFPYRGTLHYFSWCIKCLLNLRFGLKDAPLFRGKNFEIKVENKDGYPVQADGEFIGRSPTSSISITQNKIRVLEA